LRRATPAAVASRRFAAASLLILGLLAAGCAPPPSPRSAPPPPVTPRGEPSPAEATGPPGPLRLEGEPTIDVGLAWDVDAANLTLEPGTPVATSVGRIGRRSGELVIRSDRVQPGVIDFGLDVPHSVLPAGDTLWIGDPERPGQARTGWNGKSWRGAFKVFAGPRGGITLAVRLPLETYLLGVVPLEIGGLTKDLVEAGRAQAIAARSYTLFYRGRRASEGFDLYGTVEDQVYGPVESERPLATECVGDTRGKVALYDGQPIRANYCSTCGGITAGVWEAWPAAPLPYLESRRDADDHGDWCATSPQYRWRERWTAAEFLADVARFGPQQGLQLPAGGLGELVDVRVDARSRSGRVWRLLVRTTACDLAIPAYAVRGTLRRSGSPGAILRSDLFKVDVRRDPAGRRALEVVASGAGAGHGVGLCQTGALGMARAGAKAEEILEHYYQRATLKKLY
jgi:stage II sporulation protein D